MHVVQYGKGVDYDSRLWRLSFVCVCVCIKQSTSFVSTSDLFQQSTIYQRWYKDNQQSQISPHSAIKFPRDRVKDSTL